LKYINVYKLRLDKLEINMFPAEIWSKIILSTNLLDDPKGYSNLASTSKAMKYFADRMVKYEFEYIYGPSTYSARVMLQIHKLRINRVFSSPGTIEVSNYINTFYCRNADESNFINGKDKIDALMSATKIKFVAYKGNADFMCETLRLKEAEIVDQCSYIYTTHNIYTVNRFYISKLPSDGKYPLFPNLMTVRYDTNIKDTSPLKHAFPGAIINNGVDDIIQKINNIC